LSELFNEDFVHAMAIHVEDFEAEATAFKAIT
jgi:hypothetical protein